jgi:hypothetical protein
VRHTAHCSAERERHMSLEALIGGKIFIFVTSLVLTCIQMSNFKNKLGLHWSARKSNKVVFFSSPLIPRFILS